MPISAQTRLCMVIGDPIAHSLSPQMHNAAYQKLGIDGGYVFVASKVKVENLENFILGIRAMNVRGVSCTLPHKIEVMQYLDEVDEVARTIGAVNTIVNTNGTLKGYNTDWLGVVAPLEKITSLQNKKVALLGAGGAARAVVYGLSQRGAKITIFNRSLEKAVPLAKEFGCEIAPLTAQAEIKQMDIIFNATSVGLHPHEEATPIDKKYLTDKQIVFDAVYTPYETQLLKEAKQQGAQVIHGLEMLLQQGVAQFLLYTGQTAPEQTMRNVLLELVCK